MSLPTYEQATRFLSPLKGGLTIITSRDLSSRKRLGRHLIACARLQSIETTILDTDSFYCINTNVLTEGGTPTPRGKLLLLQGRSFAPESLIPLLSWGNGLLLVDDVNSLYSLASDSPGFQQVGLWLKFLSMNARANGSWAIATAYRPKIESEKPSYRSLAVVGDNLVEAGLQGDSLRFKAKGLWPDGVLEV